MGYGVGMDDKTRRNLGGLCIGVVLLGLGLLVRFGYDDLDLVGGVLILAGALTAAVTLLILGLDLLRPRQDSGLDR